MPVLGFGTWQLRGSSVVNSVLRALEVGEHVGLPLHRFPLERTADAHDAVEHGAVGKVLVDIS